MVSIKTYNKLYKRRPKIDSTTKEGGYGRDMSIFMEAQSCWESLRSLRKECARNARYVKGEQWDDVVQTPDGATKEKNYIASQGKIPFTNNRIRPLINSILGQFSQNRTEPVCVSRDRDEQKLGEMMSITMQYIYQRNHLWELDRRELQSFLTNGVAVFRTGYGLIDGTETPDAIVKTVNVNRFFVDRGMEDFRHWDCNVVGEIHDSHLHDVIASFADGDPERAQTIRQIYRNVKFEDYSTSIDNLDDRHFTDMRFSYTNDPTRCRVIEIWKKESKERIHVHDTLKGEWYKVEIEEKPLLEAINKQRIDEQTQAGVAPEDMRLLETEWFVDRFWYCRFLSPMGDVLKEMESPYWHKSHPYSFKLYPFHNGEVQSFVSGCIDQQRYINRLVTMQDFIMGAAAKGVLMFPEDAKPEGMTMREVADQWVRYNGIIYYKPKAGVPAPHQVVTNSSTAGVYDMLNVQLKMLDDISGVGGALRGQDSRPGTAASLYAQQAQNSSLNLVDILESYREVREARDVKLMQTAQQYYSDVRYINIAGSAYSREVKVFDPQKVKNIDFDLSLSESQSTHAYRMINNDMLMQLFQAQAISAKMLLENGSFPFADRLLQSIEAEEKRLSEQQNAMAAQQQAAQAPIPATPNALPQ